MMLDTDGAAEYLHCAKSRVQELAASGLLRGCKIGRGYVFRQCWLDAFLEAEADRQRAAARVDDKAPTRKARQSKKALPDLSRYETA